MLGLAVLPGAFWLSLSSGGAFPGEMVQGDQSCAGFAALVWDGFAAFSRAPAPPAPWLRLCSSAGGALEGVNSCLKIPKSLSTTGASDKPEPSSFLKGKQNVPFFTARLSVQSAGRAGQRGFRGRLPEAHFI